MDIHRLSRRICAFAFETARRDGRIAEDRYLHIFVFGTDIFSRFRVCQCLGACTHEFVGQKRGDYVGIICLL